MVVMNFIGDQSIFYKLIVFYKPPEGSSYHLTIDSDSATLTSASERLNIQNVVLNVATNTCNRGAKRDPLISGSTTRPLIKTYNIHFT